jgi:hypothetical protein
VYRKLNRNVSQSYRNLSTLFLKEGKNLGAIPFHLFVRKEEDSKKQIHFLSFFISSWSPFSFQFTAHDCVSPEWSGRRDSAHKPPGRNTSIGCQRKLLGESSGRTRGLSYLHSCDELDNFTCGQKSLSQLREILHTTYFALISYQLGTTFIVVSFNLQLMMLRS